MHVMEAGVIAGPVSEGGGVFRRDEMIYERLE